MRAAHAEVPPSVAPTSTADKMFSSPRVVRRPRLAPPPGGRDAGAPSQELIIAQALGSDRAIAPSRSLPDPPVPSLPPPPPSHRRPRWARLPIPQEGG